MSAEVGVEELAKRLFRPSYTKHFGMVVCCELCERWAQEQTDIEHYPSEAYRVAMLYPLLSATPSEQESGE